MPPTEVAEKDKVERDKIDEERANHVKAEQERVLKESPPPEVKRPERKADGSLTRAGMEAVIKAGGSVSHQGKVYTKVDDLPDEATLSEGDAKASAAVRDSIHAQIAALSSQLAAVEKTHAGNLESEKKKGEKAEPEKAETHGHGHAAKR